MKKSILNLGALVAMVLLGACKDNRDGFLPNLPPVANAGVNQTIPFGQLATLSGTESTDPDGSIQSYQWVQVGGTNTVLADSTSATTTFAPPLSEETLEFELTVTDNEGAIDRDRVRVTITVEHFNTLVVPISNPDPFDPSGKITMYDNADTLSGDSVPTRTIDGPLSQTVTPQSMAYDSRSDSLIVPRLFNSDVLFFQGISNADGDVMPHRQLLGAGAFASSVAVDEQRNEVYVKYNGGVSVFSDADIVDGIIEPLRQISGTNTLIGSDFSIADMFLDSNGDSLYLTSPGATSSAVLIFDTASSVDGDVAPTRLVRGDNVGFATPVDLAVDLKRDILYVADNGLDTIYAFNDASVINGDVVPDRVIEGADIVNTRKILLDQAKDTLYLLESGANPRILIYEEISTLDGDVTPTRVISGPSLKGSTGILGLR